MKTYYKRILVVLIVLGALVVVRLMGIDTYLTFENLKLYRDRLLDFVNSRYLVSVVLFIGAYIVSTALSIPGALVLTLAGGFLFGIPGVMYVNIGATTGATLAFLVARFMLGDWIQQKYSTQLEGFNHEIETNGRNYLLTMRLIPVIPFWLINLLSGLTRIHLLTFIWTTAVGIIPGSFVYIYAGTQLGSINSPGDIISVRILLALIFLGLLALVPVVVKKVRSDA